MWLPKEVFPDSLFVYSEMDLQAFFKLRKSFLTNFKVGKVLYSTWLTEECKKYNVNPKIILVLLEREWLLVSQKSKPSGHMLNKCLGIRLVDGFEYQHTVALDFLSKTFIKNKKLRNNQPTLLIDAGVLKLRATNACTSTLYQYPSDSAPWTGDTTSIFYSKWKSHGSHKLWTIWKTWWEDELKQAR